jgi:hypothetical protein
MDPEISGHLGDRLSRLPDDPDRPFSELPIELLVVSLPSLLLYAMPPRNGGMLTVC